MNLTKYIKSDRAPLVENVSTYQFTITPPPARRQQPPSEVRHPHRRGFMVTLRHTAFGRTPLVEWQTRRRYLYVTTYNTHKRQISIPPGGFEPTILSTERPQTRTLDRVSTGTGLLRRIHYVFLQFLNFHFYRAILQRKTSKILVRINNSNTISFLWKSHATNIMVCVIIEESIDRLISVFNVQIWGNS